MLVRQGRRVAAVLGLVLLAAAPGAAAAGDDRAATIAAALVAGRPYVEAQEVGGDPDLWTGRLTSALAAQDFGTPVHVAAWVTDGDRRPESDEVMAATAEDGVYLLALDGRLETRTTGLARADDRRVSALVDEATAVLDEVRRRGGLDLDSTEALGVAEAWVWLRLAAPGAPSALALATELVDDPSVLVGTGPYELRPDDQEYFEPFSPAALIIVAGVVLGYLGVRVALARWAPPRRAGSVVVPVVAGAPPPTRAATAAETTRLQGEVTALAEAVSRADAHPGQLTYDRAQACLDAASWYADHGLADARCRTGVALLAADGRAWLGGRPPRPRCYFNPGHRIEATGDAVRLGDTVVPCCASCARSVRAGDEPDVLRLDGRAYFIEDDVWSTTGYGSLSSDWAEHVVRDATGAGR